MGTDVGVSLSVASSANSALDQRFANIFGDNTAGGAALKWWVLPSVLGVVLLLGLAWIWRK